MYNYRIVFCLLMLTVQCTLAQTESLSPKNFKERMEKTENAVVLDVRTPEEFSEGHLKAAVNANVQDDDFDSKIDGLDRNETYFVYCKAGVRSARAIEKMKAKGFKKLVGLEGGIDEWKEEGLAVEK